MRLVLPDTPQPFSVLSAGMLQAPETGQGVLAAKRVWERLPALAGGDAALPL